MSFPHWLELIHLKNKSRILIKNCSVPTWTKGQSWLMFSFPLVRMSSFNELCQDCQLSSSPDLFMTSSWVLLFLQRVGSLVSEYDSHFGCERSRVQFPDKPLNYHHPVLQMVFHTTQCLCTWVCRCKSSFLLFSIDGKDWSVPSTLPKRSNTSILWGYLAQSGFERRNQGSYSSLLLCPDAWHHRGYARKQERQKNTSEPLDGPMASWNTRLSNHGAHLRYTMEATWTCILTIPRSCQSLTAENHKQRVCRWSLWPLMDTSVQFN